MQLTANAAARFTCLILEDDPVSADLIADAIQRENGDPHVCESIAQALDAIEEAYFDVAILDYMLPDGTGAEFFYVMRDRGIPAPTIMLTGQPDLAKAVELTRNGLFDYLPKPFSLRDFVHCLRKVLVRIRQTDLDAFPEFVSRSPQMSEVRRLVQQAVEHPRVTVLLTGETGVGKDLTARMIHQLSIPGGGGSRPFIPVNCATLPAEMFEAELFGAEKGAYTGAHHTRVGLVEASEDGTLFLDEVAEIPMNQQAKLLQFIETREFRRLGSTQSRAFRGRIIAATNKPLDVEVKEGRFRADLWYRLEVLSIHLPPLRERLEDVPSLTGFLLEKLAQRHGRTTPIVRPESMALLEAYPFPGNVRELRNVLERSLLQTPGDSRWLEMDRVWLRAQSKLAGAAPAAALPASALPAAPAAAPETGAAPNLQSQNAPRQLSPIEATEYDLIQRVLAEEDGVIRRAALRLGMSHQSLLRRLQKWPELRPIRS